MRRDRSVWKRPTGAGARALIALAVASIVWIAPSLGHAQWRGYRAGDGQSAAHRATEGMRAHGQQMNLEAGMELRRDLRRMQRAPEVEELRARGNRDAVERFRSRVLAEDANDRRATQVRIDATTRRRMGYEVSELDRLLARSDLGALSRHLISERRAALIAQRQAQETDATVRELQREVTRREAEDAARLAPAAALEPARP